MKRGMKRAILMNLSGPGFPRGGFGIRRIIRLKYDIRSIEK
jgi:hypothetical protein